MRYLRDGCICLKYFASTYIIQMKDTGTNFIMIRFLLPLSKNKCKDDQFCGKNCGHQISTVNKLCSFVHIKTPLLPRTYISFHFMDIYIAPLQGIYSEAPPTPARRKRTVLRLDRNTDGIDLGRKRRSRGSPFQVEGPRTEKARFCLMKVRANGTWRRPCSDDYGYNYDGR